MKKTIHLFFAASLFFTQQCLHAVFISLNSYENDNHKKVFLIGDEHTEFLQTEYNEINNLDNEHQKISLSCFYTLAMKKKPIDILLEARVNEQAKMTKFLKLFPEVIEHRAPCIIGLAKFAEEKNYSYSTLNFRPFDLRTKNLRTPILSIDYLTSLFENCCTEDNISSFPYNFISDISVALYTQKLNSLKKKCENTQNFDQLDSNIEQLKKLLHENSTSDQQEVREVLIRYLTEETTNGNDQNIIDTVNYISNFLLKDIADAALEIGLNDSIKNEDDILIFTGFAHAQTADKLLKKHGYRHIESESIGIPIETNIKELSYGDGHCSPQDVQTFLNKITENKICEECHQSSVQRCKRCKVAKYCSTDCQKTNWYYHKLFCKKIAGEKLTN